MNKFSSRIFFLRVISILTLLAFGWQPVFAAYIYPTAKSSTSVVNKPSNGDAPPPLPRSCIGGGTPLNYSEPICCVSGYVYLNGSPAVGATATVSANGQTVTTQTLVQVGSAQPYYSVSLDTDPLNVQVDQIVTVTASLNNQSQSVTFSAKPGGQQVDVVLIQTVVNSTWVNAYLPSRMASGMVYDSDRQKIVLFGGSLGDGVTDLNDTWEFDGLSWSQQTPSVSPSPRRDLSMAYDEAHHVVIMFGGFNNEGVLQDTWEWDGEKWSQLNPSISPSPRRGASVVYDEARQKVILFGGFGTGPLNDTWEWDGSNWQKLNPSVSPSVRVYSAMAYDSISQKTVLFGGQGLNSTDLGDTWEWNGSNWSWRSTLIHPTNRYAAAMTYDLSDRHMVLFGGEDRNGSTLDDTWFWNGMSWTKNPPPQSLSLSSRSYAGMVYDNQNLSIYLFSGYNPSNGDRYTADDSWKFENSQWNTWDIANSSIWYTGGTLTYEKNGVTLFVGGYDPGALGEPAFSAEWDGTNWIYLNPQANPPARDGHRLASNTNGSQILLFGGIGIDGSYLDDTWIWNGSGWSNPTPSVRPSARTKYSLTYIDSEGEWLLFGGVNDSGYLNDTWEYDGNTWTQIHPTNIPPARTDTSLTYDSSRDRAVLVGGQGDSGPLNDIWEWDGTNWKQVHPIQPLGPRAGHAAAYDSNRHVVVVAGGIGSKTDTEEWNGVYWRPRISNPDLPDMYNLAMAYDPVHDRLIAMNGENASGPILGTYLQQILSAPNNAPPVATIQRVNPRDARQGIDSIDVQGAGADADSTNIIQAYRWSYKGQLLSTQASFSLPAASLPLGEQTIDFQVQDDEGTWSPVAHQQVYIRTASASTGGGHTWTLLIYADGDNSLDSYLGDYTATNGMLARLKSAGPQPGVQVGILYDGPGANDTRRYILDADGSWSKENFPEARMDDMTTLRDFILWGTSHFQSDYTVLAIADHANGIVGIAEDRTSNNDGSAFITPIKLRSALQAATDDGAHKLDVVYFDGCSFGLFEDAAIVAGLSNYLVASPNTGWGVFAYDIYRQKAAEASSPQDLAQYIADSYAIAVSSHQLPYTISAFDLAHFDELDQAIGSLGDALIAYINADPYTRIAQLKSLRAQIQKYDSGGSKRMEIDNDDSYIDLLHLSRTLQSSINDPSIASAAATVVSILNGSQPFMIAEHHASGSFLYYDAAVGHDRTFTINLDHAGGIGLYYPPRSTTDNSSAYVHYITDQLFDVTHNWGWTRFLSQGLPPQLGGDPSTMPSDVLLSPLFSSDIPSANNNFIYLPAVQNK